MRAGLASDRIVLKPVLPADIHLFERRRHCLGPAGTPWSTTDASFPTLLFVGRICQQKGLDLLLLAFRSVREEFPSATLKMVGAGDELDVWRTWAEQRSCAGGVVWLGNLERTEVSDLMSRSHLLVLSSLYEGFARVLIEAAVAGLPAVSTLVSGADDGIVHGITGSIVSERSFQAFSSACLTLLRDADALRAASEQAREHGRRLVSASRRNADLQREIWRQAIEARFERT